MGTFNIKFDLSPMTELNLFKIFRQYEEDFRIMLEAGVFNFENGRAIIYRSSDGILKDIDIKVKTFRRQKRITS